MLIITDDVLKYHLHTDIIKLGNMKLSEYIELQNNLLYYIPHKIKQYDIIIYSLGLYDNSEDIHELYKKLIKGKTTTYFLIPPGYSLDFAEIFNDFEDDIQIAFNINDIKDDKQSFLHYSSEKIKTNEIEDDYFDLKDDYERYLYLTEKIKYFESFKGRSSLYIINGKLMSYIQINEECDYNIEKSKMRIDQLNCQKEIDDRKNNVMHFLNLINNEKPNYIKTENRYIRSCVYEALEKYHSKIWCQRKKENIKIIAQYPQCRKHKCRLTGACDCCDDPFCCGPYCEMCDDIYYCNHAVDSGEELYSCKTTVGLNIFYEKPKFKCKEFN